MMLGMSEAERERVEMRSDIKSLKAALAALAGAVDKYATTHAHAGEPEALDLAATARLVVCHCDEVITA
jgi:hypothetical protein